MGSFSKTLSTILVERIGDFLASSFIALIGLMFISRNFPFYELFLMSLIIYMTIFLFSIYIFSSSARLKRVTRIIQRIFFFVKSIRGEKKLEYFSNLATQSFREMKKKSVAGIVFLTSFICWFLEGVIVYLSLLCLGVQANFIEILVITQVATLVSALTFLPGSIGSLEIMLSIGIMSLSNIPFSLATASVLIARFLGLWSYIILGAIFLFSMRKKLSI